MEKLTQELDRLIKTLPNEDTFRQKLENLSSVYPFSEYEYVISALLSAERLTFDDYVELRDDYITRNRFLHIFEISAPRTFGEAWAQGHLSELVPDLMKPHKKHDEGYSGEYDFFLDGKIKIEVKASRAVDFNSMDSLYIKALGAESTKDFDMNFQQVKPACCDVFIWVGVWRDKIRYWVLASKEVANDRYYAPGQHRGNVGEGQLHIRRDNMSEFTRYETRSTDLLQAIRSAYQRQLS